MKEKILIVDDDAAVLTMLGKVVVNYGYEAKTVASGEEALQLVSDENFSLLLLDINLGGIDGFEVIRELRRLGKNLPIIVISARKEEYDTVYGLDIGADDYVTKPFNPMVLGAKIKAVLRRAGEDTAEDSVMTTVGPFTYNTSTLRFYKNGQEIPLTGKENSIMKLFFDNVGKVFSKEMIYDMVWGEILSDDNSVMVYINRIRAKIEEDSSHPRYIQNIRGVGYRFVV